MKLNPTRHSSANGEVWVMVAFKAKYCHKIFDIQAVREFFLVYTECNKPTSKYGSEMYPFHFKPVAEQSEILADRLGGDKEIIILFKITISSLISSS